MELSRILFTVASSMFIAIGALHTMVHFRELVTDTAKEQLTKVPGFPLMGAKANVWKLWQGMSLLFGVFMSTIGILNILAMRAVGANTFPPLSICILNILVLLLIIYSGFKYFTKMQVYGGILGILLFGTSAWLGF